MTDEETDATQEAAREPLGPFALYILRPTWIGGQPKPADRIDDVAWVGDYLAHWHEEHVAAREAEPKPSAAWQSVTAEGTTTGKSPRSRRPSPGRRTRFEDLDR